MSTTERSAENVAALRATENIARLRAAMKASGLDAVVVSRVDHYHYVTALKTLDIKWYLHRQAAIVTHEAVACLPPLPDVTAAQAAGRFDLVVGVPIAHSAWPAILARTLTELGVEGKSIGYDPSLPYQVIAELSRTIPGRLQDAGDTLAQARAVKNPSEIAVIRDGLRIVEAALQEGFDALMPGMREMELSALIASFMLKHGADGYGFPPIVSSGLNFALPLRFATEKVIEPNELVNFCAAPLCQGYYGELHRMSATGPLHGEQADMYRVVHAALLAAIAAIRPGQPMQALDDALRGTVRAAGYGPYEQKHVTAHGLGCNVLDYPLIGDPGAPVTGRFEPGMVIHVVSGIFKPGVAGARVSEMVLVTPDGAEVISRLGHPFLPR